VLEEALLAVGLGVECVVALFVVAVLLPAVPEARRVAVNVEELEEDGGVADERTNQLPPQLRWMPRWINTIRMEHPQKLI